MLQHQERTNISEVKCRDEAQRWRTENIGLLQLHLLAALWMTLTKNISDFKNILLYFFIIKHVSPYRTRRKHEQKPFDVSHEQEGEGVCEQAFPVGWWRCWWCWCLFFVFLRWGGVEHQEPSGCFFTRK